MTVLRHTFDFLFARNKVTMLMKLFQLIYINFKFLLQSDNELLDTIRNEKKIEGHRPFLSKVMRTKKLAHVIQHGLYRFIIKENRR